MEFYSFEFLLFFVTVALGVFYLPKRLKLVWLLLSSLYFYGMFLREFVYVLVLVGLVTYLLGILIDKSRLRIRKKIWLGVGVLFNLGLLVVFKYLQFGLDILGIEHLVGWVKSPVITSLVLPIGLSFYVLQGVGYLIDVYRGKLNVEINPIRFGLFMAFFPRLISGPIERGESFLKQLDGVGRFDYERVVEGMSLFSWGLFKKLVADRIDAEIVSVLFAMPTIFKGKPVWIVVYTLSLWIYLDFSGYIDMARGIAKIIGIELAVNFDKPWRAISIKDFWKRWHVSLSSWFRDYVYFPLGGNRVEAVRWAVNILVVFGLSGLWHGANWTFVVWGLMHGGVYLLQEAEWWGKKMLLGLWLKLNGWMRRIAEIVVTFSFVSVAWVFFRAENLDKARLIVGNLWLAEVGDTTALLGGLYLVGLAIAILLVEELTKRRNVRKLVIHLPVVVRWGIYVVWVAVLLNLGLDEKVPFIYEQF